MLQLTPTPGPGPEASPRRGTSPAAREVVRLVLCAVGSEQYALPMAAIHSIGQAGLAGQRLTGKELPVTRMAHRSGMRQNSGSHGPEFWGMPLRTGKELPVTPLGELLGFPASPRRSRYLVVVRTKASAHGLLVDRVSQVLTLSSEHLQPLPSTIATPGPLPFSRVIVAREQFMLLVDPGKLLEPVAPRIDPVTRTAPAFPECSPPTRVPEQILLFRTQDFHPGDRPLSFAINLHRVREVVDVPDIIPVPLLPSCWVGLARWRERAVPVLDLAGWLGLPPAFFDRGTRLLIVQPHGGDVLALVIRTSVRMLRLPLAHRPCEQEVALDRSRIRGMVETTRETVVVPDLQQIAQA